MKNIGITIKIFGNCHEVEHRGIYIYSLLKKIFGKYRKYFGKYLKISKVYDTLYFMIETQIYINVINAFATATKPALLLHPAHPIF